MVQGKEKEEHVWPGSLDSYVLAHQWELHFFVAPAPLHPQMKLNPISEFVPF